MFKKIIAVILSCILLAVSGAACSQKVYTLDEVVGNLQESIPYTQLAATYSAMSIEKYDEDTVVYTFVYAKDFTGVTDEEIENFQVAADYMRQQIKKDYFLDITVIYRYADSGGNTLWEKEFVA
jgi:hypothetical protein